MGREAAAQAMVDGARFAVRLHLDGAALDVRGGVRRHIPREQISSVVVDGGHVVVATAEGDVVLDLGDEAAAWARALTTPPPSLTDKLGVRPGTAVWLVGDAPAEIVGAVGSCARASADGAALVVVTVASIDDLGRLPSLLDEHDVRVPVWVVHGKGSAAAPGAGAVREVLRAAGYRDTKVTAVSDSASATRYQRQG